MLKEVYVIKDDVKIYHYSEFMDKDETHFILSSGFFSAIKSFTLEMRSSKIDFFASENEFFIFDRIDKYNTDIVCIFNNTIEQPIARIVIKEICNIIVDSGNLKLPRGQNIVGRAHSKLSKQIEKMANSIISPEYQADTAESVFNGNDNINYLALYDIKRDETYYHNSRSSEIEENALNKQIRNLTKNVLKMLKRLGFGNNYELIEMDSFDGYVLVYSFREIVIICRTDDSAEIDDLLKIPLQILSISNSMEIEEKYLGLYNETRWIYNYFGDLTPMRGVVANNINERDIRDTINSVEDLVQMLEFDSYHMVKIYSDQPNPSYLQMMKNNTTGEYIVDLYY